MVLSLVISMFGAWAVVLLAERGLGVLFYNSFNVRSVKYYLAVRQTRYMLMYCLTLEIGHLA
jgi:hypothetical protein